MGPGGPVPAVGRGWPGRDTVPVPLGIMARCKAESLLWVLAGALCSAGLDTHVALARDRLRGAGVQTNVFILMALYQGVGVYFLLLLLLFFNLKN